MMSRELMQQALEALEAVYMPYHPVVIALRERLTQPEQEHMSERIRELAEQCVGDRPYNNSFDYEKFAELIIRECEQVSLKNSHRDDDMGAIIARQIKEHFGVLE